MSYAAVVIGVSAGGIDALKLILPALPASFPLPVAIVQHRDPHAGDFLATYTGPHNGDLDVLSAGAVQNGIDVILTLSAPGPAGQETSGSFRSPAACWNSLLGSWIWPSATTSRRKNSAAVQSVRTRILRLKVGIRDT